MRLRPLQGSTQHGPPTSLLPPLRRATIIGPSATLMEFLYPSTLQLKRVYSTPACHTDYVPSSGFCTLSTVYSSLERPALFHAGNAHGLSLFRDLPSLSGPTGSSPGNYPPGVSPPQCTVNSAMQGHPILRNLNQDHASRAITAFRALLRQ